MARGRLSSAAMRSRRCSGRTGVAIFGAVNPSPEPPQDRYGLVWPGKTDARRALHRPTEGALRPRPEASDHFDEARHAVIEGENLAVLRLLQPAYHGRIKLIYIDPPYNTGKQFIYPDDYRESVASWKAQTGSLGEAGGRYHSRWLTMMYPRPALARRLLRHDGLIAVSIDDHEVHNLRLLLDETFGPENFVAQLIWKKKSGGGGDVDLFVTDHEYVLVYARGPGATEGLDLRAEVTTSYNRVSEDGRRYSLERLDKRTLGYAASLDFPIVGPDGQTFEVHHADQDGKIRRWFEEAYERLRADSRFAELDLPPVESVHGGYFAQDDKRRARDTTGHTAADSRAYALIMREKERLLHPDEPLRFLFSHSALREGWDNPKVFQLCTLNESRSLLRKRQEIGRGLRLAVMENGERCRDPAVNRLTVVVNEAYDSFARALQVEIADETGDTFGDRTHRKGSRTPSIQRPAGGGRLTLDSRELVRTAAAALADMPPLDTRVSDGGVRTLHLVVGVRTLHSSPQSRTTSRASCSSGAAGSSLRGSAAWRE